jgi:hypothetical protein
VLAFNPLRKQLELVSYVQAWGLGPAGWTRLDDAATFVGTMVFSPALQRLVAPTAIPGISLLRGFIWADRLPWNPPANSLLAEGPDGLPMGVGASSISRPFALEVPAVASRNVSVIYPDGAEGEYLAHGLGQTGVSRSRYQRRPVVPGVELRGVFTAPVDGREVRRFTTEVWASGGGDRDGGIALGAGLQAFDGRVWRAVAAVGATDTSPQRLVHEVSDPLDVALLRQDWRSNMGAVTVTAPGPNGAGSAWINVLRAQIEIEWRLPSDAGTVDGGAP